MKTLFALLLLCTTSLALALDNAAGSPGTATPQPYGNPPTRPLPVPATGPSQSPPLLQKLPPAPSNVPAPRLPQLERQEREQQPSAEEERGSGN